MLPTQMVAESVARAVTPVPGGIGPLTDLWLLRNTVAAARRIDAARGKDRGAKPVYELEKSRYE